MQHVNQQGTTRRAMLRAGAAAGSAAAFGATGLFASGTASAATTARSRTGRLPYPSGVTDTSHCTPEVAEIFRGVFTAKSEHGLAAFMSYFSTANACYFDVCLGLDLSGWQAINTEFTTTFGSASASAISYPLTIVGDTRSAAIEFVNSPAFFSQEIRALSSVTFNSNQKIIRWVDYWDGRSSLLPNTINNSTYPADFKDSEQNADPAAVRTATALQAGPRQTSARSRCVSSRASCLPLPAQRIGARRMPSPRAASLCGRRWSCVRSATF